MSNMTYKSLPSYFFSEVSPSKVPSPKIIVYNKKLEEQLNLDAAIVNSATFLSGMASHEGEKPIAQAYAGHQFGHFTMLGDGRAALLLEHVSSDGKRFDVQLKGSGPTPYSRNGDGKAAVGPMLREYLISEALHHLGVPTTRSLAVVETGQDVYRYEPLKGAILTRIASSHIRVGTFEFVSAKKDTVGLKALADYAIERHYPEALGQINPYLRLLEQVIEKQAKLIAKWQLIGFVHGVMNTDNMSISGESIDFGPCAFLDVYDPKAVFSSIDLYGRYRYDQQPGIGLWNLRQFANTLLPLLSSDNDLARQLADQALHAYGGVYREEWFKGMASKLGIEIFEGNDQHLITDWLNLLTKHQVDYTNAHVDLTYENLENIGFSTDNGWYNRWYNRISRNPGGVDVAKTIMKAHNPVVIPRNHKVEEALTSIDKFMKMLKVLQHPYDYDKTLLEYQKPAPKNAGQYVTYCGT